MTHGPEPCLLVAIGLGSNMPPAATAPFANAPSADPRARALEGALEALEARGLAILGASSLFESEPVDVPGPQGRYLNACALARTRLALEEAFAACLEVERLAGRVRKGDRAARPLDLDVLAAWDEAGRAPVVADRGHLVVPHPRLFSRAFVLVPLAQVAPDLGIPGPDDRVRSARELLAELPSRDRASVVPGPSSPRFPPRDAALDTPDPECHAPHGSSA